MVGKSSKFDESEKFQEREKERLSDLAEEEYYHLHTASEIDKQIISIQKSTKTNIPQLSYLHNYFRMKFAWYSRWHQNKYSSLTHLVVLAIFAAAIFRGGLFLIFHNPVMVQAEIVSEDKGDMVYGQDNPPSFELITHGLIIEDQTKSVVSEMDVADKKISAMVRGSAAVVFKPTISSMPEKPDHFEISLDQPDQFKPGLYTLNITLDIKGQTQTISQDFRWGVLSINPDKSLYELGETATIAMGVLDDMGKMVCDTKMEMEISDPDQLITTISTSDGITVSPDCNKYGVTELPDFYTMIRPKKVGRYSIKLSASTPNGTRIAKDFFTVEENPEITIRRTAPTRIYPFNKYTVDLYISSNINFPGPVREEVPSSFVITPQNGMEIIEQDNQKILTWQYDFKIGESKTFSYEFDAPDISPEFYLLGAAEIGPLLDADGTTSQSDHVYREERQWEIASDVGTTKYAVNAGGVWTADATWSTVSAKDATRVANTTAPTAADDVVIDEYSGNITISAPSVCRSLDASTFVGTLTHNTATNLTIGDDTAGAGNVALAFNTPANMTYTLGNAQTSAIYFISTSATVQTVSFNSQQTGGVWFNAASNGSWQLTSQWGTGPANGSQITRINKGTLDTNNQTLNIGALYHDAATTATLTLGSSVVNCYVANSNYGINFSSTGLTLNYDTSNIKLQNSGAFNAVYNLTWYDVEFLGTASNSITQLRNDISFHNFTITGPDSSFARFATIGSPTIRNAFTVTGYAANRRLFFQTDAVGQARTVTLSGATFSTSNVDFMDITFARTDAGGLDLTAGGTVLIGDAGGNTRTGGDSTVTFSTAAAQTWANVNGGNWSDSANWTSRVPLPQDSVSMACSFGSSKSIVADQSRLGLDVNWTGVIGTPTFNISGNSTIFFGSVTLISGMNLTKSDSTGIITSFYGRGTHTVTSSGKVFNLIYFAAPGGSYTLTDDFFASTSNVTTLYAGTLDTAGYSFSAAFALSGSFVKSFDFENSTITAKQWSCAATTNSSINATGSTINLTGTTYDWAFAGGTFTYNNIVITRGGAGIGTFSGAFTFANITMTGAGAKSLKFTKSTTYTMTGSNFLSGYASNLVTINSSDGTTAATINKTGGGTILSDYLDITVINVTPASTWYYGNNSSWHSGTGWNSGVPGITISGTIYTTENKSATLNSETIALSINGAAAITTETNGSGIFSFSQVSVAANNTVSLYISGETEKGSLVSQAVDSSTNITSLELYTSHIVLSHQTAGPMTNTLLDTADNVSSTDLLVSISGGNATFASGKEIWILASKTYTPGGNVSCGSMEILSGATFSPEGNTVTLNDGGSPLTVTGTFNESTSTLIYAGKGTFDVAATTYNNLTLTNDVYRSTVTITNSSGGALSDYQVKISLTSSNFAFANSTSDGRDVRIFDADDATSLFFHIAAWDQNAQTATIWVRVPNLPTGDKSIYLHYGNSSLTSASSPENTYYFYDDFSGSSLDTDKWSSYSGESVGSGLLNLNVSSNNQAGSEDYVYGNYSMTNWSVMEIRNKSTATNATNRFGFSSERTTFYLNSTYYLGIQKFSDGNYYYDTNNNSTLSQTQGTTFDTDWHEFSIALGTNIGKFSIDGSEAYTYTTNVPTSSAMHPLIRDESQTDWIRVRGYVATEPTTSVATATSGGSTAAGDITVKSVLTISAGTFSGSNKTITLTGTGMPFVNNGVFDADTSTVKYTGAGDTTVAAATYYNIETSPSTTAVYTLASGTINIQNNYTNGDGTNAVETNATTNDPAISIDGDFTNSAGATFIASDSAGFSIASDFTNNATATFTHSSGTITFDGQGLQAITANGDSLNNLTITNASTAGVSFADSLTVVGTFTDTTASSKLTFHAGDTYAFANINLNGQAIGTRIIMQSSANDSHWHFNVSQVSPSASYVDVKDSDASGGNQIDAGTGSYNRGGNTNWLFDIAISGTVYTAENKSTNIGSGKTITLSVNGSASTSSYETLSGGTFSFSNVPVSSGKTVTLYIDDETEEGDLILQVSDTTSDISNLEMYTSKVVLRHESAGPITNSLLSTADNGDDDIKYLVTSGNVVFEDTFEAWIETGKTYTPGGNVTVGSIDINGTFSPESNTVTVRKNWDSVDGTFNESTSSVAFTAISTSGNTIDVATTDTFNIVSFNATSNTYAHNIATGDTIIVNSTLTLTNGLINGPGAINANENIIQASSMDGGTASVSFANASATQSFTSAGGIGPTIYFDSSDDAGDSVILNANTTFNGVNIATAFGDTNAVPFTYNGKSLTIQASSFTNSNFTQQSGIFTAPATLNLGTYCTFSKTGGTFDGSGTTLNWVASNTYSSNDILTFSAMGVSSGASGVIISSGVEMNVTNTLTISGGYLNGPGTINLRGNLTVLAAAAGGSGIINFDGTGDQTYSMAGIPPTGAISLEKASGFFKVINGSSSTRTITLASGSHNTGGELIIATTSTGGLTLAAAANNPTMTIPSNISFSKTSTGVPALTMGTGTWNVGGNVNFTNGTVTSGSSTLVLNSSTTGQTLTSASQSVYNLTVTNAHANGVTFADSLTLTGTFTDTTASSKLTFHALSTYAFANISINGQASGTKIVMVSSDPSNADLPSRQWYFNVSQSNPQASYVNVTDSDATGGNAITPVSCTNGGNNENWLFNVAPTNDSLTFTNPFSSNIAVADDTTEWNFEVKTSDSDGATDLDYVELRLANSSDSSQPYDSTKLRWTRSTDTFSEEADTQNSITLTSTSSDSGSSGNQWTLNFKVKIDNDFAAKDTNYAAEVYSIDDDTATDTDNYQNTFQVTALILTLELDSAELDFASLLPGSVVTDTTTTTVTCNHPNGYNLSISDEIPGDYSALLHSDTTTRIADYIGTILLPTTWSGTGLGITVYETSNKELKWGSGTTENDLNNKYAGVPEAATVIHTKSGGPVTNDVSKIGYKIVLPNTQKTGAYSGSVTFTATGLID